MGGLIVMWVGGVVGLGRATSIAGAGSGLWH